MSSPLSRRARLRLAALVAAMAAAGIVVLAVVVTGGRDHSGLPASFDTHAAGAPFAGFRETSLRVDDRCRRVAVADTEALREEGLRGHDDLGPYAGMLFAFDRDTDISFTMSGVDAPLEIGWYAADGTRVDRAHLAPCPHRGQQDCPVYASKRSYRVAFERSGGHATPSQLTPCG